MALHNTRCLSLPRQAFKVLPHHHHHHPNRPPSKVDILEWALMGTLNLLKPQLHLDQVKEDR
jgi:hypothetical protein